MESTRRELGFAEMILRKGRPKKKKAPVIKKSEVEEKLLFEMGMREAAQRLLSACSNPQQRYLLLSVIYLVDTFVNMAMAKTDKITLLV